MFRVDVHGKREDSMVGLMKAAILTMNDRLRRPPGSGSRLDYESRIWRYRVCVVL
ncbi:hypothetical protein LguiB_001670 [Lonicera macranthoides]